MLVEFRQSWQDQTEAMELAKHADVLRRELMEMAASIEQARREVAALRPPDNNKDKIVTATSELDAIVISTERASFEILNAAEKLMDFSGRLRAEGANGELCSGIENEVTNIFTACSFQDLTGQRTGKVVNALRYIEQRINAMMSIWGEEGLRGAKPIAEEQHDKRPDAHLLNGPQLEGDGVSQADVDSMFGGPAAAPAPAPAPVSTGAPQSQADIDSMFDSPAPVASAGEPQSQADIDSLFDAPSPPPPPPPPPKPAVKPIAAAKPPTPPKIAPPPKVVKPVAKAEPKAEEPPTPLDQSAIDALFG